MDNIYNLSNRNQIPNLDKIYTECFGETKEGVVVDVGAHDGYTWSNSWPLIRLGWYGLLIEPHPGFCDKIRKLWINHNVDVIQKAAVSTQETSSIMLYEAGSLTTIIEDRIPTYGKINWTKGYVTGEEIEVETDTLDNILNSVNISSEFEVFTLDCEGAEYQILQGFDLEYWRPKLALIETLEKLKDEERVSLASLDGKFYQYCDDLFNEKGYTKRFSDDVNSIYIRNE